MEHGSTQKLGVIRVPQNYAWGGVGGSLVGAGAGCGLRRKMRRSNRITP